MLILLVIQCVLILAASLIGGWLPNLVKLNHRHTRMVLSLVSGAMQGGAFFHLLPRSIELLDNKKTALVTPLVGLLFIFFLIRMFHSHDRLAISGMLILGVVAAIVIDPLPL